MNNIFIPKTLYNLSDHEKVFLNLLGNLSSFNKDSDGWADLSSSLLTSNINHSYVKIRDKLIKLGMIEWNKSYKIGTKRNGQCQKYRIAPYYLNKEWVSTTIQHKKLKKNLDKYEDQIRNPQTDLDKWLQKQIGKIILEGYDDNLKPDFGPNRRVWETFTKYNLEGILPRFSVCDFGFRRHSDLSMCKKKYRKFLTVDGEQLVGLDIVESQPMFLVWLLKDLLKRQEKSIISIYYYYYSLSHSISNCYISILLVDEISFWDGIQEKNGFYSFLVDKTGIPCYKIKREFVKWLFSGGKSTWIAVNSPIQEVFQEYFPSCLKLIKKLKFRDYKIVAKMLQREESNFVYKKVCKRLMDEQKDNQDFFIGTIHDSFVCKEKDMNYVNNVILNEAQKIRLPVKLKFDKSFERIN